jgi:cell division protein FtsW (lipid II flippase)
MSWVDGSWWAWLLLLSVLLFVAGRRWPWLIVLMLVVVIGVGLILLIGVADVGVVGQMVR